MKKVLLILGFFFVCVVIGLVILAFSLGALIKKGVNDIGPKLTQTPVSLDGASMSPLAGTATLRGLVVGNPQGWASDKAFSLGEIHVDLDPRTVLDSPIIINELVIDQPRFTYETRLTGGSNIKDLLENIRKVVGEGGAAQEGEGAPRKFVIRKLRLRDGVVNVGLGGAQAQVPLPELAYDDLGVKEGGLTGGQLAGVVLNDILGRVVTVATTRGLIKLPVSATGKGLEGLGQALQQLMGAGGERATPPPEKK